MDFIWELWRGSHPEPFRGAEFGEWDTFFSHIVMRFWWVSLVGALVIVGCYVLLARFRRVHSPSDIFLPYRPLYVLWGALFVPLEIFRFYVTQYKVEYQDSAFDAWRFGALHLALPGAALTFVLSAIGILLFTPAKFRLRPLGFYYRWQHRRRS